jgi:hypothetical protein
VPFLKGWLLTT